MQNGQNSPEGVLCVHREVSSVRSLKAFTAFKRSALKATALFYIIKSFAIIKCYLFYLFAAHSLYLSQYLGYISKIY